MKKITKRVLLEEIQRINEIMKGSSKLILNEQSTEFIEKLFRGGEEEVSNVVKSIEKSGIRGADDVASAFRSLVEKGFTKLTEEESLFLANVIRQIYPDVANQVRRSLSDLLIAEMGPIRVGKLEDILANEKYPTERLYDYMTKNLGMENLTVLELQVWRDALKRTPSEIKIPTTVEVKPKPENVIPPVELKLTPAEESLLNQSVDETINKIDTVTPIEVNSIEEANSEFNRLLSTISDPKITDAIKGQLIEAYNKQISSKQFSETAKNTEKLLDMVSEIEKTKGPEVAKKALDDATEKLPRHQKSLIRRIWDRVNTKDPFERKVIIYSSVAMSVGQLIYTWVDSNLQGDKYKGLFGLGLTSTMLIKGGILLFSGFWGTGVYFIGNVILTVMDIIKTIYHSIQKDFGPKDPNEKSLVDAAKETIGGKLFYITLEEAEIYAEAEPPKEGFDTLVDTDVLTYVLLDKDSKKIETTNKKQQGSFVQVYKNDEVFVTLHKVNGGVIKPV